MPGRNEVHRATHTHECPDAYNFVGKDKIAYFFLPLPYVTKERDSVYP